MEVQSRNLTSLLGAIAAAILVAVGILWAFTRGANDFNVFYTAWDHVAHARGLDIYRVTPDRFLYAPGFAWLFAPLAWLPKNVALALWCLAKAAIIVGLIRKIPHAWAPWAVVLIARPLLIDFQYGQVNLLILGACAWACFRHCDPEEGGEWQDVLSWICLGVAAVGKLFPLPLILIPFFVSSLGATKLSKSKLRREQFGVLAGVALVLLLPVISVGFSGWASLMGQWKLALMDRGFPLESHNQSFGAFLHHYASGVPTEIIAQHRRQTLFGWAFLAPERIQMLMAAWSAFFAGMILTWILGVPRAAGDFDRNRWVAMLCGLLILPSHLVWKPYFIMGLPAACVVLGKAQSSKRLWIGIFAVFLLMNCTSFDLLGQEWGAGFEAASCLLWAHLLLLCLLRKSRQLLPSRAL